jgi:hypothetical protein
MQMIQNLSINYLITAKYLSLGHFSNLTRQEADQYTCSMLALARYKNLVCLHATKKCNLI